MKRTLFTVMAAMFLAACGSDSGMSDDDMMADMASQDDMMDEDMMVDEDMMMEEDMMVDEDMMMEDMAETTSTMFLVTYENVGTMHPFLKSGIFNTPAGDDEPGPATPGKYYEVQFTAGPGARLSLATMFGQSNDLFYAPGPEGIALYGEDGMPLSGDITDMIMLWDAGTEVNEEPGVGENQAPRQTEPDTGPAEDGVVMASEDVDDGFTYPAVDEVLTVTLTPGEDFAFTLKIENISDGVLTDAEDNPAPAPNSPGVWVIHSAAGPLFMVGEADMGHGLERIAEDGNPADLGDYLGTMSGLWTPLSPGAWAVYQGDNPFFTDGEADMGEGLEHVAEDADPTALSESLAEADGVIASGIFNTVVGGEGPGPAFPGDSFTFEIEAMPGDKLNFVSMFGQSNDLFYGSAMGVALFDGDDMPVSGDVTAEFGLWDAGTEVNQEPGVGDNQAPRQSGPDTGDDEGGMVMLVDDGFDYPAVMDVIKVTVTPK